MRLAIFFVMFWLVFPVHNAIAQDETDQQLAAYYYQNGEFEKAVMYYEKLYKTSPVTFYYEYYFKCLVELKKYVDAEKLARKHAKSDPRNLVIYLDIADVLNLQEKPKDAEEEYDKAIKHLVPDYNQVYRLAEAFSDRNMYDHALQVYQRGNKLLNDEYRFAELEAVIYARKGIHAECFKRLLDLLALYPVRLPTVEAYVSGLVDFEKEENPVAETFRVELMRRIQKYPDNDAYNELLTWYYEQKGDFSGAFTQIKALDKRQGMRGEKVYDFAWLCLNNNELEVATRAFEYVAEIGPSSSFYLQARKGLLDVLYRKIVEIGIYSTEDVTRLLTQYELMLKEMGENTATAEVIKQYAHILAFHASLPDSAVSYLEYGINRGGMTVANQCMLKLELADVYVLQGNIWDASLLYGQVEHAFKHDILGHEAKFRNARVYYYSGDFEWSQAQLSVLKASTSKLIANDAMELSLLITETIGLDSLREPLEIYSRADFLYAQHAYDKALLTLDTLGKKYPFHGIGDEALYLKFRIEKSRGNIDAAKTHLESIVNNFPKDLKADDAVFNLAELFEFYYKDNEKAADYYKKILFDYPGSLHNVVARKRYRALRGETNFKE
jgi:tetratricopeptide (TPR) repeat protein